MSVMTINRIRSGDSRIIGNLLFIYYVAGVIQIYSEGDRVGEILFESDEITTTQHFEEKIMWWAHEYNRI